MAGSPLPPTPLAGFYGADRRPRVLTDAAVSNLRLVDVIHDTNTAAAVSGARAAVVKALTDASAVEA